MKLIITIQEPSFEAAVEAIRGLREDHDGVELRAEHLGEIDLAALRASTTKLLILTHRGTSVGPEVVARAVAAGIDLVDVEWREGIEISEHRDRVILSHHDFDGMPDIEPLLAAMRERGCAQTKLAVTPRTLDDNLRLVSAGGPGVTVIGMGERGLFSRILAPFRGSELAFAGLRRAAAPGQITIDTALAIYGTNREQLHARHVFAIAGNPAGHSLSPAIHNPRFRERGADAAYTIASFEEFGPVAKAVAHGEIRGVSVTAPFKEEAYAFALAEGAAIGENARRAGAVNTLVHLRGGLLAENTDVDGFEVLIRRATALAPVRNAAVAGAGGTARAALVALERCAVPVRVFNRTPRAEPVDCEPLAELARAKSDLVINTLPAGVEVALPPHMPLYIEAAYPAVRGSGTVQTFTGLDLLHAQAVRQNDIFVEAIS